jgi:Sec-independent protein translocase protein TatA
MIFRILFYAFLIYLAYKLLFELIIPLYRTTKKIKRGIREMQQKMEQQQHQQNGNATSPDPNAAKSKAGDYIDFEEVK